MDGDGSPSHGSKYECLLFDMDDTLYPMSAGLNLACRKNIQEYMLQHLQIEESEVPRMCLELYKEYGTTMAGLKAMGYEFDDDEFHAYVHGRLPYDTLKPDPILRNLLLSMPQRKIIFTNADKAHAAQVLKGLGLEDCFEGIICFETLNPPLQSYDDDHLGSDGGDGVDGGDDDYHLSGGGGDDDCVLLPKIESETTCNGEFSKSRIICKPSPEAFEAAIKIANVDPNKTIFFDDSVRNIASGKAAGLHTVIVGSSELVPGADLALSSIHNIKEAVPEIWEGEGDSGGDHELGQILHQSTAVQTFVLA
ncbi:uncharacterized protein C24B11.05 [Macadamia integrifolia]|uniref:uncharacterized protein C24B11.05 n=1 Tax=Macadamia integrifolia TaxID=60698 RepID=UPI001C4E86CC|nr:uncharacterized protein C24B11.05 [Macadamia integrifolia]XP_042491698.1 uncharacterized protein C24B11.05 [Macadamia integrifolia]XP_042491699.1 uncharacterized protein C24B11.05 [Macadamia integrifolia]